MKTIEQIAENFRISIDRRSDDGFNGVISFPSWQGSFVCSTGAGWEHVSVAPFHRRIVPSWDDMCTVKDIFWYKDEAVIQIHPPEAEYVNNIPNCLHLWRCTYREMVLPPSVLVGIRKGQTADQIKAELAEAFRIASDLQPSCDNVARYRYYKGGEYELISSDVIHTETGERLVVYKNLRGQVFARPEEQFYGIVETEDGEKVPRFVLIWE